MSSPRRLASGKPARDVRSEYSDGLLRSQGRESNRLALMYGELERARKVRRDELTYERKAAELQLQASIAAGYIRPVSTRPLAKGFLYQRPLSSVVYDKLHEERVREEERVRSLIHDRQASPRGRAAGAGRPATQGKLRGQRGVRQGCKENGGGPGESGGLIKEKRAPKGGADDVGSYEENKAERQCSVWDILSQPKHRPQGRRDARSPAVSTIGTISSAQRAARTSYAPVSVLLNPKDSDLKSPRGTRTTPRGGLTRTTPSHVPAGKTPAMLPTRVRGSASAAVPNNVETPKPEVLVLNSREVDHVSSPVRVVIEDVYDLRQMSQYEGLNGVHTPRVPASTPTSGSGSRLASPVDSPHR